MDTAPQVLLPVTRAPLVTLVIWYPVSAGHTTGLLLTRMMGREVSLLPLASTAVYCSVTCSSSERQQP